MAKPTHPLLVSISEFSRGADFPVIGVTASGHIVEVNGDAENILGVKKKKLINQPLFTYFSLASQKKIDKILRHSADLKSFRDHVDFITTEGTITASLIFFPIYEEAGKKPAYFILAFNDPHKAAQLQIEIEAANRIADLNMKRLHTTNLKLVEARKAEQEAIKAKEHFFASISHEIRTPLNGILGITKLLADTALDVKQREFIDAVINSSEQLLNIINDLLDLSKINSFNFKFDNEAFNLQHSLHHIVPVFRIIAANKQLKFNVEIEPLVPRIIIGDKFRLNQIINNLLNNAFKFTLKGSVRFTVKVLKQSREDAELQFEVCDTGIGISKQNLEKVFDTFTPAATNTSKQYGGTGLGLSISKHLVELMGGHIEVSSQVGKGTCFTFTLTYPVAENQDVVLHNPLTQSNVSGSVKILAVDDNEVNRFYIKNLFPSGNIRVYTAENGKECLEILKNESFDIILMDLQMPILDGFKTTERIRNRLHLNTPIIALTAASVAQEEKKCLKTGMNEVMQKPFTREALIKVIGNYIQASEEDGSAAIPEEAVSSFINMDMVYSIAGTDKEKINELIDLSLNNIRTETKRLQQAISEKNYPQVKAVAHKLKSTFGLYGLNAIHEGLYQLEELSKKQKNIQEIEKAFSILLTPIEQSARELQKIRER